jgi:uncharacterized repeat protein (TIGR02543 family)
MKKLLFFMLISLATMSLVACDDKGLDDGKIPDGTEDTYLITLETNGGTTIGSITVDEGTTLTLPSEPTKEGYTFDGWYMDADFTTIFDATMNITDNLTLYAKWTEIITQDGPGLIEVLDTLPSTDITIEFWVVLGGNRYTVLEDLVDAFEEDYPNITVNMTNRGTNDNLHRDLEGIMTQGNLPTVFAASIDEMMFVRAMTNIRGMEQPIPLDDFMYHNTYGIDVDDFVPSFIEENKQYTEQGYLYSFPFTRSTEIAIFNLTQLGPYIPIPGDNIFTWDDLETMHSNTTCEYMATFDYPNSFYTSSSLMWNAPFTSQAGELLIDNPTSVSMIEEIERLFTAKVLSVPQSYQEYYSSPKFLEEDLCMSITSLGATRFYADASFPLGFAPIPQYDKTNLVTPVIGTNLAISGEATSEEQLAAWVLLQYLTSADVQASFALQADTVPVHYDSYDIGVYADFLAITDSNHPDYVRSQAHNAAYQMLEHYQYQPSFYGSFTSKNAYDHLDLIILSLVGVYSAEEALQEYLNEMAKYE